MQHVPVLQRHEQLLQLPRLQVTTHRVFHLELLFTLVELSPHDVQIDRVDDQLLEGMDGREV